MDIESTAASTLADLTKLIEEKPSTSTSTLNKLSRFLNPDILKKKPTISNIVKQSDTMIDLTDTKKVPTIKSMINISLGKSMREDEEESIVSLRLDCIKSPSSSKKLLDMQKQLGIRMRAKTSGEC